MVGFAATGSAAQASIRTVANTPLAATTFVSATLGNASLTLQHKLSAALAAATALSVPLSLFHNLSASLVSTFSASAGAMPLIYGWPGPGPDTAVVQSDNQNLTITDDSSVAIVIPATNPAPSVDAQAAVVVKSDGRFR